MTLNWQDIDKQLHVVSAQHTSRGLMVSRSEMEAVLPAGSIVVGVDWSGTESDHFSVKHTEHRRRRTSNTSFRPSAEAAAKKGAKKNATAN